MPVRLTVVHFFIWHTMIVYSGKLPSMQTTHCRDSNPLWSFRLISLAFEPRLSLLTFHSFGSWNPFFVTSFIFWSSFLVVIEFKMFYKPCISPKANESFLASTALDWDEAANNRREANRDLPPSIFNKLKNLYLACDRDDILFQFKTWPNTKSFNRWTVFDLLKGQ